LEIESTMSTTYHLQTDKQIEYVNHILEQYLRYHVDYNQKTIRLATKCRVCIQQSSRWKNKQKSLNMTEIQEQVQY